MRMSLKFETSILWISIFQKQKNCQRRWNSTKQMTTQNRHKMETFEKDTKNNIKNLLELNSSTILNIFSGILK